MSPLLAIDDDSRNMTIRAKRERNTDREPSRLSDGSLFGEFSNPPANESTRRDRHMNELHPPARKQAAFTEAATALPQGVSIQFVQSSSGFKMLPLSRKIRLVASSMV